MQQFSEFVSCWVSSHHLYGFFALSYVYLKSHVYLIPYVKFPPFERPGIVSFSGQTDKGVNEHWHM